MTTIRQILIVEDSDDDYEVTIRCLKKANYNINHIIRFSSAEDFINSINTKDQQIKNKSVLLLDLNLTYLDGFSVISMLKNSQYQDIPIIILSTTDNPEDINYCYKLGVSAFIHKDIDLDRFQHSIIKFKEFWIDNKRD